MSISDKNKKWFIVKAIVSVCLAFSPPQAKADTWLERQKLLAGDGAASDYFGYSVSISGDFAIAGSYADDDKGNASGSAYIFEWDGANWSQQAKLLAFDGAASDYFGYSVSISGDFAIAGAYGDDDKGGNSGSAYIFKRDGETWSQQAKLVASDGAAADYFGWAVSISGDYALVVARYDDDKGTDSGSAYIFKRDGTSWSQQVKLTASDGAANDNFGGWSVSINGDLAIVGARGDSDMGYASGSAYIFKRAGETWVEQTKLLADDGDANDYFGISASISGDFAVVGAYGNDDSGDRSGSAYIFTPDDIDPNNWIQRQKLTASDGNTDDYFGWSVSISGDYAIIGARQDDDMGSNSGSAYIFKRIGASWVEQQKLLASDGAASDYFGYSVSISGNKAIAGAYNDVSAAGSAYAFRSCPRADLDDDCKVDFADFAIFADWWLYGTD